jgi:N-acetylglucosaminyl-diphospho-decaprenol L-rhamnosyltransferase
MDAVTSVVITRNRRETLLRTLGRIEQLGVRVVVVDNGSDDGTPAAIRGRFPAVSLIALGRNRGAAARMEAARAVETPFVAFSDDDSWWAPRALELAVRTLLDHPGIGLVAARILVGEDERLDPVSEAMGRSPLANQTGAPGRRVLGFTACGAVCRTDALLRCDGPNARYGIGGEEALLALDLAADGLACIHHPAVVAYHYPERSASAEATHRARDRTAARNDLWTAWLRLQPRDAVRASVCVLRRRGGLAGAVAATTGVAWVIRNRKPVPAAVSREFADLAVSNSHGRRGDRLPRRPRSVRQSR